MNVLSLFDGMSCGQIALKRIGAKVDKYYASEIDKYAIQIAQKNFPNTIQLGDVTTINAKDLQIDLLIGGSPCQGFSFSGKRLNFDDPRSKLFFEFERILKECKPKYFLLENVKMSKASQEVISKTLGVEPRIINSSLVSAQHRQRLYWTNIPFDVPKDKGILLKDILEDGIASDKMTTDGKAYCLTARYQGAVWWNSIERKQRTMVKVDKPISENGLKQVGVANLNGHDILKRVYSSEGKSPTLNSCSGGNREPKIEVPNKSHTIKAQYYKSSRANFETNKSGFKATGIKDANNHWRKLTPIECERLQTVDDNYTEGVSNTQRYKMLGNGWTVDVIAHIFKSITTKGVTYEPKQSAKDLFSVNARG